MKTLAHLVRELTHLKGLMGRIEGGEAEATEDGGITRLNGLSLSKFLGVE